MAERSNAQYLQSKITTASQPRLHLMLIEGASRQCRVAEQAGRAEYWGEFYAAIDKALDIIEELARSVSGTKNEISEKLEEQYAFLYRELAAARFSLDLPKLATCAKLLDFERDTWKQVCEKNDVAPVSRQAVIAPSLNLDSAYSGESFSFEA